MSRGTEFGPPETTFSFSEIVEASEEEREDGEPAKAVLGELAGSSILVASVSSGFGPELLLATSGCCWASAVLLLTVRKIGPNSGMYEVNTSELN